MKLPRNGPCPCGSGTKFKRCCAGKVRWDEVLANRPHEVPYRLTLRGKNRFFLQLIGQALGFKDKQKPTWQDVKARCTPEAVRNIHLAVSVVWPDREDLARIFHQNDESPGLYVGHYDPAHLIRGVSRHAIYADQVLLFDPFMDHRILREKFNPVTNPERFVTLTLRNLSMWYALAPWIDAGLACFVRSPGDFDRELWSDCMEEQRERARRPRIREALRESVDDMAPVYMNWMTQQWFLSTPDEQLTVRFREMNINATQDEVRDFIDDVHEMRRADPYYVGGPSGWHSQESDVLATSSGANYSLARFTASLCNAHLITDLPSRWLEIEEDRQSAGVNAKAWEPFAKAMQGAPLRFIANGTPEILRRLREEERLASMRSFLRKVWKASSETPEFGEQNARHLADQLEHEVALAKTEWERIDQELAKWAGMTAAGAMAGVAATIANGAANFVAAGAAIAGGAELLMARYKRRAFRRNHPAAFFLDLKKG